MEELLFVEGDVKGFEKMVELEMTKPIKHFEKELASIRTGRASTALLDGIKVEAYGQLTPLNAVATLAAPDARLITIQIWDKSVVADVQRALLASDIGITPTVDGQVIRLQLPQMTQARREELVKTLSKKTEECKIGVRNVRKEFHNQIRDEEKKNSMSEDFAKRLTESLQKVTDKFIAKVDEIHNKKEHEIRLI